MIVIIVAGGYGEVIKAAVRCAGRSSAVGGCCVGTVIVGIAIPAVAVSAIVVVT